jgi:Na+:H+ antiporter, NhaA family
LPLSTTQDFQRIEATAGLLLLVAAAVALVIANSPVAAGYAQLLEQRIALGIEPLRLTKTVLHWINDGLMAVFFLLVGLELKREILAGELSTRQQAALPVIAAIGGMAVPGLVYALLNRDSPGTLAGWPIPAATDIAYALGVLAIVADRVPASLRAFLLGLAIIDDLGAVILIALLFTADISALALALAAMCVAALFALNRLGITRLAPYLLVGSLLWLCVLKSGVHATLAGVAIGLAIPLRVPATLPGDPPLLRLEHALRPWVIYLIMPVFALANAGVSFAGLTTAAFADPVMLGIAAGLFVGKQLGVFGAAWLAIRAGVAAMPGGAGWRGLYGVSVLTGIGFTMSLFIGSLAFPAGDQDASVRLGVLAGSVLSAVAGCAWLLRLPRRSGAAGLGNP